MKTYSDYVNEISKLKALAANLPLGAVSNKIFDGKSSRKSGKKIFIFAPHPDDEVIIGSLALRLQAQDGYEVTDVAVTLGSNIARRNERRQELADACNYLGWNVIVCGENGLDNINPKSREENKDLWANAIGVIAKIISDNKPDIIIAPHIADWNKTHIGVGLLVRDALALLGSSFNGIFIESEFWGAMSSPNLMIEISEEHIAAQITALSCHTKEVLRNDYHLRLPFWLADNVRRGGEIVGGQGCEAPSFTFGIIYNVLKKDSNGVFSSAFKSKFVGASESIDAIL